MAKDKETIDCKELGMTEERLMRISDVSRRIGVGKTALRDWIHMGIFPPGRVVGRRCRVWKKSEIDNFINSL